MLIYIAGSYVGEIGKTCETVRELAMDCYEQGHSVLSPHLCCEAVGLRSGMELLRRADAMLLAEGWKDSDGVKSEIAYAERVGIPVYHGVPPLHPTELERPAQVTAFIEMVMSMYRLHLGKNADYSPANILGTGEIGVVVRLWDKVARLLNLTGFKLNVSVSEFDRPKAPLHEAIEDTLVDTANYAVIAKLLRDGKWGR